MNLEHLQGTKVVNISQELHGRMLEIYIKFSNGTILRLKECNPTEDWAEAHTEWAIE